jgi:hypothetical protein
MHQHELEDRSRLLHVAATHHDPQERKKAAAEVTEKFGMSPHDVYLNTHQQYLWAAVHRIEEKLDTLSTSPATVSAVPTTSNAPATANAFENAFESSTLYRIAFWIWSRFN